MSAPRGQVLLLPGAGAGGWEWMRWCAVLEQAGFTSHPLDLVPGGDGLAATQWADYVAQACAAAAALAPPRVVVGASLGGLLALAVSERVACAALVLVNPLPPLPEAAALPARAPYPAIVPWRREARLAGTRRALPDADDATCLYAFRHWRDESGAVLNSAYAGIALTSFAGPSLLIATDGDTDVPPALTAQLAQRLGASLLRLPGSHVGPLLGRQAVDCAAQAVAWLNTRPEFRTD